MSLLRALSSRVPPITRDEFAKFFQKSRPPVGWPETIAVGNSGGPDSTCLLFLINRHLKENAGQPDIPRRVVSVHVNHGLQAASNDMARQCEEVAKSLGVEHHTHSVPWDEQGISPKPEENSPIMEYSARIARYRTLFFAMLHTKADVLAMGHHLDDQVETAVMRIYKGSTEEGAGGMRFCRRWGMGFGSQRPNADIGWNAHEGMRRWIARPLLGLPKERLLATCEENQLEYVTDETNTMAHVTIRNAIRMWLKNKGEQSEDSARLDRIERKVSHLKSDLVSLDLSSGVEQLYGAVMALNAQAQDIESQVDSILSRCTLRSPPGTWMTTCRGISFVRDEKLRRALVLRILRFISFHPWGSLKAQVKRRNMGLMQISEKLWDPNPLSPVIPEFCAGGGVQWAPVIIQGSNFRFPRHSSPFLTEGQSVGWMAFRQRPPTMVWRVDARDSLRVDLTPILASHLQLGTVFEYLYDCRFLLTFDLAKIPGDILRIIRDPDHGEGLWLKPCTKWFWPRLVWKRVGHEDVVLHSKVTLQSPPPATVGFDSQLNLSSKPEVFWHDNPQPEVPWVKAEFIRTLSSL
ncbi:hypothetical protein E1B28_009240 [Marasmius oreades]|uniref:tRNA(Ile)-lysidine synthetase n=1 Tax=Marasmius oreades TaxID=181124 RepID=A0A9P7S0P3_9AGAR|nr:uncharacterized protein E1B28_009240 [Marasmius oreades]KAG7092935.1 hypothetical protein E1B28_009240 [Marasmius oreades]